MSKRKLLLADDSVTIQKVVNLTFADEGIDVVTASDGDTAMQLFRADRPDIVLADVNMPGANGYQICEMIRTADETKHIPVILLVGSFEPFDEIEASRVGANAFLTKPFQSIRQLVAQVSDLLGPEVVEEKVRHEPEMIDSGEIEIPMIARTERSDDIESLYQQSVTGDLGPAVPPARPDLGDQGLDDEMIETSFTGRDAESETLHYEPAEHNASPFAASVETEPATSDEVSYAMPVADDGPPIASERSYIFEPEPPPAYQALEMKEQPYTFEEAAQPPAYEAPLVDDQSYAFESAAPTEEFTSSAAGFAMPDQDPSPEAVHEPGNEVSEESELTPPSYIGQETVSFQSPISQSTTEQYDFDDIELLDLPPVAANETVELTSAERAQLMGSNKRVLSVSPELMDLIVEKVVEKLSQKY